MLLAIDLHEYFIDIEDIAISLVLSLQPPCIERSKLDTPEADRFPSDDDASLGQEVFDISMAKIESVIEPDCVADDIGWESVAIIGVHPPILTITAT